MLSAFFISRPKFAFVIAIVTIIAGVLAIGVFPVAEYPELTPPQVQVSAKYPGADANVVAETVAAVIEAEVNGVEGMTYMSSKRSNDGSYTLTVTFSIETDGDTAQINVQNRVSQAMPKLPEEAKRQGITTEKKSTSMLSVISVYSPNGTYDDIFLSNYSSINLRDTLARVGGVASVEILGARDYGMRIWLDPDRLTALSLTASDIIGAIRDQNIQAAPGAIGQQPTPDTQQFQYTLTAQGRLESVSEFGNIILVANSDGSVVKLKDVAKVELGAENYSWFGQLNGKPAALLAIYQLPDANAFAVAGNIESEMERLAQRFPDDLDYQVTYDTTLYVETSIREVVITLLQALALVVLVVYIFLQDWRSTLIPAIAIPVSLIGTFAALLAMGFTINTISLFGLILAIGVVVDDAIIVVENVQRHMAEGLSPPDATRKAMEEVTAPVIATTLVLLRRVRAGGVHAGPDGAVVREIRRHHLRRRCPVVDQCADAESGFVRDDPKAAERGKVGAARMVRERPQFGAQRLQQSGEGPDQRHGRRPGDRRGGVWGNDLCRRIAADWLHPGGGSWRVLHRHSLARRRGAAAHRGGAD